MIENENMAASYNRPQYVKSLLSWLRWSILVTTSCQIASETGDHFDVEDCEVCIRHAEFNIDGFLQERHNSIANALELRLTCTNPSMYSPSPNAVFAISLAGTMIPIIIFFCRLIQNISTKPFHCLLCNAHCIISTFVWRFVCLFECLLVHSRVKHLNNGRITCVSPYQWWPFVDTCGPFY